MEKMDIKVFIFDWSGTLSDDAKNCHTTAMKMEKYFGIKRDLDIDEWRKEAKANAVDFFKSIRVDVEPQEMMKLFIKYYKENERGSKPFDDSADILSFLKSKNKRIAVVSAHPQDLLDEEAREYGFDKFVQSFEGAVTDKAARLKQIVEELGIDRSKIAYVGDMIWDIRAAKEAGIKSIAVLRGYQKEILKDENPDIAVNSLTELKGLVA